MKKSWVLVLFVICGLMLSGCITIKRIKEPRSDQKLWGNQGYITGTPKPQKRRNIKNERLYIDIEVPDDWGFFTHDEKSKTEQSSSSSAAKSHTAKDASTYNTDLTIGKRIREDDKAPDRSKMIKSQNMKNQSMQNVDEKETFVYYKVKPNDTLWMIASMEEHYGDGSKWRKIYKANRDVLAYPGDLKPGMVLKVPLDEPSKSRPKYKK